MVALAILGMALVAIFQLFSISLRSTKKAEDYTKALFYARSMVDETYSLVDPAEASGSLDFREDFKGTRTVTLMAADEEEKSKLYEITVTVTWPPSGSLTLRSLRTVYAPE